MRRYTLEVGGKPIVIEVQEVTADRYMVRVEGQDYEVRLSSDEDVKGTPITPQIIPARGNLGPAAALAPRAAPPPAPEPAATSPSLPSPLTDGNVVGTLIAPMPGKILSVDVNRGDRVSRGQTLVTLEAMKMKNAIKSPFDGVVLEIAVRPEQTVAHGALLVQLGEE
jgi:biotin carboxyl carrier protein